MNAIRDIATTDKSRLDDALHTVTNHSYYAAAIGIIPVPVVDIAGITGVQLHMIREISEIYGVRFSSRLGRSILASLLGATGATAASYGGLIRLAKSVPGIGPLLGVLTLPTVALTTTYAVGAAFITHFEEGGVLEDIDVDQLKDQIREFMRRLNKDGLSPAGEETEPFQNFGRVMSRFFDRVKDDLDGDDTVVAQTEVQPTGDQQLQQLAANIGRALGVAEADDECGPEDQMARLRRALKRFMKKVQCEIDGPVWSDEPEDLPTQLAMLVGNINRLVARKLGDEDPHAHRHHDKPNPADMVRELTRFTANVNDLLEQINQKLERENRGDGKKGNGGPADANGGGSGSGPGSGGSGSRETTLRKDKKA